MGADRLTLMSWRSATRLACTAHFCRPRAAVQLPQCRHSNLPQHFRASGDGNADNPDLCKCGKCVPPGKSQFANDSQRRAAMQRDFPIAVIRSGLDGLYPIRSFAAPVSEVSVADHPVICWVRFNRRERPRADFRPPQDAAVQRH